MILETAFRPWTDYLCGITNQNNLTAMRKREEPTLAQREHLGRRCIQP